MVIEFLNGSGLTQGQIGALTGLHQNRLSDCKTGKRVPKEYSVFASFADGLGLPSAARQRAFWMTQVTIKNSRTAA